MVDGERHDDTSVVGAGDFGEPGRGVALSRGDVSAISALPPAAALLIVQRPANAAGRYLIDSERTTIGRDPQADVFLDDVTVSRKHAEVVAERRGFAIRDVGSLNGTYVNRQRIEFIPLHAGDEVQIGKFHLRYYPSPRHQSDIDS